MLTNQRGAVLELSGRAGGAVGERGPERAGDYVEVAG
jgi:hypothetical protein